MFEQDIQLARLLLEKCQASQERRETVQERLAGLEAQLTEQLAIRHERENYADLMAKAAALLERPDLEVAIPDTSALELEVEDAREEARIAVEQASQFEELLRELESRAPAIVASARGEADVAGADQYLVEADDEQDAVLAADSPAESDAVEQTEPDPADGPDQTDEESADATTEELDDASTAVTDGERISEVIEDETPVVDAYDAGNLLKRFNLHSLKTKEAFTYGRGAAYLIDAASVMERVPNYDMTLRGGESSTLRDELLRDFDQLSRELSGTFYLVFDSWYHPLTSVGNRVGAVYTTGELEGTRQGARHRVAELLKELAGKHHTLCLVTSDEDLIQQHRDDDLFIISLAEFFNF